MVCTFIGHRTIFADIQQILREALIKMIEQNGVDRFFVGHQGDFDSMVYKELKKLKKVYPHMDYKVVLAYYSPKREGNSVEEGDTLFPLGIERVPYRYAISWRNNWLIDKSDFLIAYVKGESGNAHAFLKKATGKGLVVVNLAE